MRRARFALACLAMLAATPGRADAVADFYKGATVTIDVGYGPGGGYDLSARLVSRFLGRHIPGHPNVVVRNTPGGGGLKVANDLFNGASKDGLSLGVFSSDVALEPLYGDKQARFKVDAFTWIGSMDTDLMSCGVWKGAGVGIKTAQDLVAATKTVSFGSSAPSADTSLYPLFFKNALGAPTKVVNGYSGTRDIVLAMRRGEVDGGCGLFESSVRASYAREVASGDLVLFVQVGMDKRSPLFAGATPISDLLATDEMKAIGQLVFGPSLITRPLAAPPGTPADRAAALRKALLDTVADPEAQAEGAKLGMSLTPLDGARTQAMFADFMATPKDLVKKAFDYTHVE
jgi:tripartite-type tricarboxylate transporter receptor subunit TctC